MKITNIISERRYKTAPSFNTVFEWEDVIARDYPLNLVEESILTKKIYSLIRKLKLVNFYHFFLPNKRNKSLRFIMKALPEKTCILNKNVIPVIIDFWLQTEDLDAFYNAYKNSPKVLVTSAEIVEFLKQHNCPLPIEHWPLSLPDKYKITKKESFLKEYELCFIGRPNPFFEKMLRRYENENPDFIYVKSNGTEKNREYITNKGEFIGKDTGRDSYWEIIRKTKITCYSTPGIDDAKLSSNKFNQVTPRLFEMLAGGCYVIGRYPDNADTRFYEIEDLIPNVNNYTDFKRILEKYRIAEQQKPSNCVSFLDNHYTSKRVPILKQILTKETR